MEAQAVIVAVKVPAKIIAINIIANTNTNTVGMVVTEDLRNLYI